MDEVRIERCVKGEARRSPYYEIHKDVINKQDNKCTQCGRSLLFADKLYTMRRGICCDKCVEIVRAKEHFDDIRNSGRK